LRFEWIIRLAMKNSDTSIPVRKRLADDGQAASTLQDVCSAGSPEPLARCIVLNRSQRNLEIDLDYGIQTLAHGGNEWT
jgi:hypothetical protein